MKATIPAVTAAARERTARLGARKVAAKRKRQYGTTSSSAMRDLATYWCVTSAGSILTASDRPPRMAKRERDPTGTADPVANPLQRR